MKAKMIDANGYVRIEGNKYLHRHVAEQALGRKLNTKEIVHHIDYNKQNNSTNNLIICTQQYHRLIHARTDIVLKGGDPDTQAYCSACKEVRDLENFCKSKGRWNGRHHACRLCVSSYKKSKGYNLNKFNWKARLSQQYRRVKTINWIDERRTQDTHEEGREHG